MPKSEHESASQSINKTLLTLFTDVFLSSVAGLESALPLLTGLLCVKMAAGVCVCVCVCVCVYIYVCVLLYVDIQYPVPFACVCMLSVEKRVPDPGAVKL